MYDAQINITCVLDVFLNKYARTSAIFSGFRPLSSLVTRVVVGKRSYGRAIMLPCLVRQICYGWTVRYSGRFDLSTV